MSGTADRDASTVSASRFNPMALFAWERYRARGRLAFILGVGVVGIGVPVALLIEAVTLLFREDSGRVLSAAHAIELTFVTLLVAPIVGAVIAGAWWDRLDARSRDATGIAEEPADIIEVEPVVADAEQRKLATLRARLDTLARDDPRRLTREIIAMTVLGYGYVLLAIAVLVGAVIALEQVSGSLAPVARQAAWFVGWYAFFVLTALWVKLLEPTGRRITRAGSPALFDALGRVQQRLDAPAPDVVLLDPDFNAAVTEIPRFGIFGLPKRYLKIGLPLLEGLPPDECVAILAHEMAHLSRRHARRGAWTARLSVTWAALAASLQVGRHWGRPLFLPFFRWYSPRFELYAQAVSRRDEHESDAMAGDCAGPVVAARALLRLHVYRRFVAERLLPDVYHQSLERPDPPAHVFDQMATALRDGPSPDDARRWARAQLAERTLDSESHPSLAERIARLVGNHGDPGAESLIDEIIELRFSSGAAELLGAARLPKLRTQVEHDWQIKTLPAWRRLHSDALLWRGAPRENGFETELTALWAHARWSIECERPDVALRLVREVLHRAPAHVEAKIMLGRLLTESDDPSARADGVATLESVMRRDTGLALIACAALEAHYQQSGWREEVNRVQTRARQLRGELLAGAGERRRLRANDYLTPYQLPHPSLATLRKACATHPEVTRAFLVRKRTRWLREQPCVMLAIECSVPWYRPATGATAGAAGLALLERIVLPEAADLFVIPVEARTALRRRLGRIRGAMIYERA